MRCSILNNLWIEEIDKYGNRGDLRLLMRLRLHHPKTKTVSRVRLHRVVSGEWKNGAEIGVFWGVQKKLAP